jgi:epoxyqueuosine reductase
MTTDSPTPIDYSPGLLIKKTAREIGFSEVGIADIKPGEDSDGAFGRWLDNGMHGEMRYLSGGANKRHDPGVLLDGAKSVISVAVNYYSRTNEFKNQSRDQTGNGVFSIYAHGKDYHIVLAEMLHELARRLDGFFPNLKTAVCVDTQPVSERDFAIRSGVAWLGKNTCVISPTYGSWIFLGELITNLDLQRDDPLESLCGSCTLCVDTCPTGALDGEYLLDATRCISYLTIEKRGDIPAELHEAIGGNLFGCDECQQVCPYNATPTESETFDDQARNALLDMELGDLECVSDADFRSFTRESAIGRCKPAGLRRNARIVAQNIQGRNKPS